MGAPNGSAGWWRRSSGTLVEKKSLNFEEGGGLAGEVLGALFCDDDDVFDSDSEFVLEVDAGFDGEGHARLKVVFGACAGEDEARIVGFEADAVAESVGEGFAEARCGDDLSGDTVDFAGVDSGADGRDGGLLGLADDLVDVAHLRVGFSKREGAGHVGGVAL